MSYNTRDLLARCVASLPAAAAGLALQTIVVDNGSRDGSLVAVRERFPDVVAIDSGGNLGFAKANNLGFERAVGRVRVWLNPDCEMSPGSLRALVSYLDEHPEVGAVGPRLDYEDGRSQPSAQRFPSALRVLVHFLGLARWAPRLPVGIRRVLGRVMGGEARGYLDALSPGDGPRAVDWVSGACIAVRAEVARRVGPLDEGYFMYSEDTDWCQRVHQHGWDIHFVPTIAVVHQVGASAPSNPLVVEQYYRSLLRYFSRHRPGSFWAIRSLMCAGFVTRACGQALAKRLGGRSCQPWWRLAVACWDGSGDRAQPGPISRGGG